MSKVVLITGGSSGIGKAIGEFLFHKGFTVYGTSRNPEKITNGRGGGIRTHDLLVPNEARYQAAPRPD